MANLTCPVQSVMDLLKGKYTIEILTQIFNGNQHFNSLLRAIPEINSRILAKRLHEFEDNDFIKKTVLKSDAPKSIEYNLTEKGLALREIFNEMTLWSNLYC
ncbi:MAG: winged helix-turn-helix transcriptional regulator [Lactococcus sp.]